MLSYMDDQEFAEFNNTFFLNDFLDYLRSWVDLGTSIKDCLEKYEKCRRGVYDEYMRYRSWLCIPDSCKPPLKVKFTVIVIQHDTEMEYPLHARPYGVPIEEIRMDGQMIYNHEIRQKTRTSHIRF